MTKLKALYFGTPVVILATLNPDRTTNIAPMSSAWWLGQDAMLGMSVHSQTSANLSRTGECVINLVPSSLVEAVDRLALLTGRREVPAYKRGMGYRFEQDKFRAAGLTRTRSEQVGPDRVAECPIQLECRLVARHEFASVDGTAAFAFQVRVLQTHVDEELLVGGGYVHPGRWDPLIMKFTEFFGGGQNLRTSRLARAWEMPEVLGVTAAQR